ncbi:carnitine dehydratase [Archaeoglobales archaeon ex4484_92]|nr:MAG: carnitine dehydratase [Archaeoglobales archaeon ex4484_92]
MELLKDVKVLELGYFYPVPFCAKLLNYLGAEVIKIEPPSGDPSRLLGPIFAGFNYNKEIIKLDLKKFEDREVFYKLAKSSDVIIEGFRPGVVKRLGVDYETIKKINPKIIYCSISAFGQRTKLCGVPAHDINILGLAGILEVSGFGELRDPNIQIADFSSSVYAALLIVAALFDRKRTERGRYIDISMFHSAIFSIPLHSISILNNLGILPSFSSNPVYGIYETSDGYITIGIVGEEHFWRRFCEALNLDLNTDLFESFKHYTEIRRMIKERIKRMTTKEVLELMKKADVPVLEVLSLKEIEEIENRLGEKLVENIKFESKYAKVIKPPFKVY